MAIFIMLGLFLCVGLVIRSFTIWVRLLLCALIIGMLLYINLT